LDNERGKGITIRSMNKPGNKQTKVIALNHKKKKASEYTTMKQRGKTKTTLLSQPLKKKLLNLL